MLLPTTYERSDIAPFPIKLCPHDPGETVTGPGKLGPCEVIFGWYERETSRRIGFRVGELSIRPAGWNFELKHLRSGRHFIAHERNVSK